MYLAANTLIGWIHGLSTEENQNYSNTMQSTDTLPLVSKFALLSLKEITHVLLGELAPTAILLNRESEDWSKPETNSHFNCHSSFHSQVWWCNAFSYGNSSDWNNFFSNGNQQCIRSFEHWVNSNRETTNHYGQKWKLQQQIHYEKWF